MTAVAELNGGYGARIADTNARLAGVETRLDNRITEVARDLNTRLDHQDAAQRSVAVDVALIKAEILSDDKKESNRRSAKQISWEVKAVLAAAILGPVVTVAVAHLA